ncbi:hypothetical protein [Rhizobium setariae]|nr:hypothetical protein [Rhizobium setariae]
MAEYYVAIDGSDIANGSSSTPWKTISRAMQVQLSPAMRSW